MALVLVVALAGTGLRDVTPGWADLAPPVTLTPVGDTAISSGEPEANYGQEPTLLADEKPRHESLLRFALPAGAIEGAVLRLWVLDSSKNGPKAKRYDGTLDELALTWKTRVTPYLGSSVNTNAIKAGSWAEWDVTDLIPAGVTDVTLIVIPDSSDGADFASRESDHSPELVITPIAPPTTSSTTSSSTSTTTTSSTTTTTTTMPPATPACRPDWDDAKSFAKLEHGLSEVSGFVASPNYPEWGWGIRDSGNPTSLYAIRPDADGGPEVGEMRAYELRNHDWEDLAYSRGATGIGYLWVLDNVGNSHAGSRWIHQFVEVAPHELPRFSPPDESTETTTTTPPPPAPLVASYQWAYPDEQVNTETMFFFNDHLVVVAKSEPSRVYRFDEPLRPGILNVPTYIGTLPRGNRLSIAALSVDQRTLAVASHGKVDVYENFGDATDLFALISNHVYRQDMDSDNREGGAFFPYGSCDLVLTAESKRLWRLEHR